MTVKEYGFYRSYLTVFIKKIIRTHKSPTANLDDQDSAYIKHTFKKLGSIAKNTHTPVGIVYLSLAPQEQGLQVIKQIANNNNLFFINALEEFTRLNGESYVIDKLDSHPNEEAHKIFTESILKDSVTRLILGEKTKTPQALDTL